MDDGSADERPYTPSNLLDDLDDLSSRSDFSLDFDHNSYKGGEFIPDHDLKIDLDGVGGDNDELPMQSPDGEKKSVRLALPVNGDDGIRENGSNQDNQMLDTLRSKSSLRSSITFTSQYLSTASAAGDGIDDDNNTNNNNNFTFDQFLQTLQNSDGANSSEGAPSLGYDQRTQESDEEKRTEDGASKSEGFSDSTSKLDEQTLKSESGLNDIFENADRNETKEYDGPRTSANYISFPYGFQHKCSYEHNKKLTDLMDVTFNPRTRQFIFLDTRGITTWDKDGIEHTVTRSLNFPKYQNKLLRNIVYARKYNVYFCLAKDFSLKVLNKHFDETCQVASDLSSVMFLLFNPVRDELITGGVKGTKGLPFEESENDHCTITRLKVHRGERFITCLNFTMFTVNMVWEYKQMSDRVWTEIKPMANYSLFLKRELKSVGGSWVRKVELDQTLQHLYCCSDTDIQCYDMEGRLLFKLMKAHKSQINGCKYSPSAKLLVTGANDCEVRVWSMTGGLVHTFRAHSRSVTNLLLHPDDASLVLSSSLDGSVKMWSLDLMELMYSIVISTEGIQWMGLTGEKYLWTATCRDASVWHLNQSVRFYSVARCHVTSLQVAQAEGKTSRVVAIGEDSSVRLVSVKDERNLSTVLPPPSISPLQQVQAVTYNRECSMVYVLVDPSEIWVYTMRTDPACRTSVWDVKRMQERWYRGQSACSTRTRSPSPSSRSPSRGPTSQLGLPTQRATLHSKTNTPSLCSALASVNTHVMYYTDEGFVSPLNDNFVLFGLQDGRILFLDPVKQGHRYCELQATRDVILDMTFDKAHSNLIVQSSLREEDLFQFWSVPNLELRHEVLVTQDVTSYARLGLSFYTGHTDGALIMFTLEEIDTTKNRFQHGGYMVDSNTSACVRRLEHQAPIVAVDSCPILGIVATCSSDGAVKVWDEQKTLMTEITLDTSLSSACFLTNQGDLLIGYKNHLFLIDHTKILPSITKQQAVEEILEIESDIYEDPAVRYEGAAANPEPLNVDNYLVPFDLDFNERFLGGGLMSPEESLHSSEKGSEEGSESEVSMAKTDVYRSQVSTPRLSVIDFLTARGEPTKGEITEKALALALKKRKKARTVKWTQDQGVQPQFELPKFGISPGPSPTRTPPSTPSDVSESEDAGEDNEHLEWEEEEEADGDMKEHQEMEPIEKPTDTTVAEQIEQLKPAEPKVDTSFRLPEHLQENKSRMSRMRIDAYAIMAGSKTSKRGLDMKKKIDIKPVQVVAGEDKKQGIGEETASSSTKVKQTKSQPIKKKGLKGPRARVGERAASAAAKAKADRDAAAEKQKEEEEKKAKEQKQPKKKPSKTKTKEPEPKPSTEMKPKEEDLKADKPKPKLSTTKLDIKPLPKLPDVRKGVKPGPTIKANKEAPKKAQAKRQSVLSGFTKSKKKATNEEEKEEIADGEEKLDGEGDDKEQAATTDTSGAITPKVEEDHQKIQEGSEEPPSAQHDDVMTQGGAEEDGEGERKDPSRPGSTQSTVNSISRGPSPHKSMSRASSRYSSHRSPSIYDDATMEDDIDDENVRIMSTDGGLYSSPGLRAQSALSTMSASSYRSQYVDGHRSPYVDGHRSPYVDGDRDYDYYPLEEMDIDMYEQPNFEVMVSRNGRIEHIGSATSRTDSPFMRSVSQMTGRVPSSRAGDRSVLGSVLSDVESELWQARVSGLDGEIIASEVGLPVSPEMFGRLARPNTAEGRARRSRPQTAGGEMHVTFEDEEFDDLGVEEIPKFMSFPVTPGEIARCYKNDGLQFEENWQDRLVERNRLIKLQKQQRVQSAANRRHLLELRQRQRRKSMLGHQQCTDDLMYPKDRIASPAPTTPTKSTQHTKHLQRAQSAPAGRQQFDHSSSMPSTRQAFSAKSKGQSDFGSEKPYRLRMKQHQAKPRLNQSEIFEAFETDASNRPKLVKRAQSSKSIPSKTRRFVLVTQRPPQPDKPIPSPLEKQLLKARFPKQTRHLLMEPDDFDGAIPRRHSTPNVSRVASVADFVV